MLLALIGLAQERGARTVAELVALSATRTRRVFDKRHLAFGAPPRPGVYLFRDCNEQILYVGRARDLRARLRSYFRSERQRPQVEAALGAVERIEWRVLGSELEAALEELRLIRELRPPANARVARPGRYVWLRKRGDGVVASPNPANSARARSGHGGVHSSQHVRCRRTSSSVRRSRCPAFGGGSPSLQMRDRYEDAARLRDRLQALEQVCRELERLARLRAVARCLVAPAAEPGHARAFFIAGGRVAAERTLPPGGGAHLEIEAGLAAARHALVSDTACDLDELFLVGTFLRKPPAELQIVPLDKDMILRAAARCQTPGPVRKRRSGAKAVSGTATRCLTPTEALF